MKKTNKLKLPIYNTPDVDVFKLDDWNVANESLEKTYTEVLKFKEEIPKVNANAEIIEARDGEVSLGTKMKIISSHLADVIEKNTENNGQINSIKNEIEINKADFKKLEEGSQSMEKSINFAISSDKSSELIYGFDSLILDTGVTNYYPVGIANGECCLTNTGLIKFKGTITIDENAPSGDFITIGYIPDYYKYTRLEDESWKYGFALGENSTGKTKIIPIGLRSINGQGVLQVYKNGDDELYTKYIYLNPLLIQTEHYDVSKVNKHVDEKTKKIIERSNYCNFQFPYLTDYHWDIYDDRTGLQLDYINKIDSFVDFNCYISGGDNTLEPMLSDVNTTKKQALLAHKQFGAKMPIDKLIWCKGNHDDNSLPNDINKYLFPKDIKPTINNKKMIWAGDDLYYGYYDDEEAKIRVVIMDSFEHDYSTVTIRVPRIMTATQLDWICDNALNFMDKENREEWHTIFVAHYPPLQAEDGVLDYEGALENSGAMEAVLNSFKNGIECRIISKLHRFDIQGGMNIIGWFYGHFHSDQQQVKNGINFISSCAMYNAGYKETRIKGTISEMNMDIVSIDKKNKKIYMDRIGQGLSREFNY